jgi:3-oxoacyl-[acyl-carrier protein] reductase
MGLANFSLAGKTAVVTGAAGRRGIGRAIALTLAEAGADVAVCDINISGNDFNLNGTAEEIRKLGRQSLAVKVDITDEKAVEAFVDKVVVDFGTVDIMINNAAAGATVNYQEVTRTQWEKLLHTNVIGCHNCCKAAGRVMIQKKQGSIINMSSSTSFRSGSIFYPYGVSKAGINHITTSLAEEWVKFGVRVNAVAPGAVETDISEHDIANPIPTSERFKGQSSVMKVCKPGDIANIVLFLASDAASYLTGQILVANSGM